MAQPTPPRRPNYERRYYLVVSALLFVLLFGFFLVGEVRIASYRRGYEAGQAQAASSLGDGTATTPKPDDPFLEQMRKFREEQDAKRDAEAAKANSK